MLCDILDVPLLLADILVEVLRTIRAAVDDGNASANPAILGSECSANAVDQCISSIIVYVITKVAFTLTQVMRDAAAAANCLLCSFTWLILPSADCTAILYVSINGLATLVDSLVGTALALVVKIAIAAITAIIDLIAGDFAGFVAQLGLIFGRYVLDLVANIGQAIIAFLKELPVIGPIIRFLLTLVQGACTLLEGAINLFANPDVNLNCAAVTARRKRSSASTAGTGGWLKIDDPAVSAVWPPSCAPRLASYNASGYGALTDEQHGEVLYCLGAHFFTGAAATADLALTESLVRGPCEYRAPRLYARGAAWDALSDEERTFIRPCLTGRFATEQVRADGATWAPADLLTNPMRWPLLADDIGFAFRVLRQYESDRSFAATTVTSAAYEERWRASGLGVAHLTELRALGNNSSNTSNIAAEAAAAALARDDPLLGLALEQYVDRATDPDADGVSDYRVRDPALITGLAQLIGEWMGTAETRTMLAKRRGLATAADTVDGATSVLARFINYSLARLASRQVLDPPPLNVLAHLASAPANLSVADRAHPVQQNLVAGLDALFYDLPTLVASAYVKARDGAVFAGDTGGQLIQMAYGASVAAVTGLRLALTSTSKVLDSAAASVVQPSTVGNLIPSSHYYYYYHHHLLVHLYTPTFKMNHSFLWASSRSMLLIILDVVVSTRMSRRITRGDDRRSQGMSSASSSRGTASVPPPPSLPPYVTWYPGESTRRDRRGRTACTRSAITLAPLWCPGEEGPGLRASHMMEWESFLRGRPRETWSDSRENPL